jgi:hypothetical protein
MKKNSFIWVSTGSIALPEWKETFARLKAGEEEGGTRHRAERD